MHASRWLSLSLHQSLSVFLFLFFGDKKRIDYKSFLDLYFHLFSIKFFSFALLRFSIDEMIHTKAVVDVSRGGWGIRKF